MLYGKVILTQPSRFLTELALPPAGQPAQVGPAADTTIVSLPSPTAAADPLAPPSGASVAAPAELERALSAGDRVEHPSRGVATITAAEGPAVTAVFDHEPGKPYEMHARLARLRRLSSRGAA